MSDFARAMVRHYFSWSNTHQVNAVQREKFDRLDTSSRLSAEELVRFFILMVLGSH